MLRKRAQLNNMSNFPQKPPPGPPHAGATKKKPGGIGRKRDYSPLSWNNFFETCEDVKLESGDTFRVYRCGNQGPVLFFIHGGGHSALTWAVLSASVTKLVECQIVALDCRAHGNTSTSNDKDLSAETLSSDIGDVISTLYGDNCPPILLIGHSMGGAIAVHTAVRNLVPQLIGMVVIDVVEGSALDSLQGMPNFLLSRPSRFKSLPYAIEWAVRSGQIRNLESARVSMIGQLRRIEKGERLAGGSSTGNTIAEEDESGQTTNNSLGTQEDINSVQEEEPSYTWRIDLSTTEQFWKGWFQGLSGLFLSCSVPKLLLLAGVDRLDRDLMVGQMQGRFQMQILPQCGHSVHEDVPDKVADALATFLLRHKFAEAKADFKRP